MDKKIGFIGCGNMGGAMMEGIIGANVCKAENIITSDPMEAALKIKKEKLGVNITTDNKEVVRFSDIIFLSVKPQYYDSVIKGIKDDVTEDMIIVTIAPGKTLDYLSKTFENDNLKIIRTMPNTPAMVGEGMMGMCPNKNVTEDEVALICEICNGFSKTEVVAENLMDVVTAVSGSSPAYVYMFIEAMADAAVAGGMPRAQAYKFAAQAVLGSAKMVLETGKHPGDLKDMVCSPAGTTIQAVRVLEEKGMRSAVIEAMMKCLDISRGM